MYVYVYIYIHMCICMGIYIHIYIYRYILAASILGFGISYGPLCSLQGSLGLWSSARLPLGGPGSYRQTITKLTSQTEPGQLYLRGF